MKPKGGCLLLISQNKPAEYQWIPLALDFQKQAYRMLVDIVQVVSPGKSLYNISRGLSVETSYYGSPGISL